MQAILEHMNPDLQEKLMPKLTHTCNSIKEKLSTGKADQNNMETMNTDIDACLDKLKKITA